MLWTQCKFRQRCHFEVMSWIFDSFIEKWKKSWSGVFAKRFCCKKINISDYVMSFKSFRQTTYRMLLKFFSICGRCKRTMGTKIKKTTASSCGHQNNQKQYATKGPKIKCWWSQKKTHVMKKKGFKIVQVYKLLSITLFLAKKNCLEL